MVDVTFHLLYIYAFSYALVFGGIRLDDEVMSIVTGTNSKQHIDHSSLPLSPLVRIAAYLLQTDI